MQEIIFFGSSSFSCVVLDKLVTSNKCQVTAVVTKPDKPVGRHLKLTPNPVKVLAQKYNLTVIESLMVINSHISSGTIGLVAAYGKILKPEVLDKFKGQIYNIHPSLLPKYRGPSPLQQQILDGVVETGVTIIQMDALMDHGPIVAVAHDTIRPDDTAVTLGNRLFEIGANLFLKNCFQISNFKFQNENEATYTKLLTRQDGFVEWEELKKLIETNSPVLSRRFRAFHPWPGVWTLSPSGKRLKVISLDPIQVQQEGSLRLSNKL